MAISPIAAAALQDKAKPPPRPVQPPVRFEVAAPASRTVALPAPAPRPELKRSAAAPAKSGGARPGDATPLALVNDGDGVSWLGREPLQERSGRDGSGGDGEGQPDQRAQGDFSTAGACGMLDTEDMLDLLPTEGASGIFEVLFPDGESMGVAVDIAGENANFLLSPRTDKMRSMLGARKLELQAGLARRMLKNIRITVL